MNLTAGDRKLIVITVAATVAANLITVVVVALAIIIARGFRPQPITATSYFALVSVTATPALIAIITFSIRRDLRKSTSITGKVVRWIMTAVMAVASFALLLLLLSWVGFASGVK